MMVIRGTLAEDGGFGLTLNVTTYFPADRCTWRQSDYSATNGGYDISEATYWTGAFSSASGSTRNGALSISSPELGYIGKSGRLVPITAL